MKISKIAIITAIVLSCTFLVKYNKELVFWTMSIDLNPTTEVVPTAPAVPFKN
jgi:hypothetical protein